MPKPRMKADKPKNIKTATLQLIRALKPWRLSVIFACVFAAGSTALAIFGPNILGNMTTDAVNSLTSSPDHQINWGPIVGSAITLIILYVVSGIFGYLESYLIGRATAKLGQDLRSKILDKISRLPISYFDKTQFGDTLSRMSNDVDIMTESLQNSLSDTISNIVMIVGTLIMMFTISPWLSLIAIITVPLSLIFVGKSAKFAQKHFHAQQNILGKLNSKIEESYAGSIVIKVNSHQPASVAALLHAKEPLHLDPVPVVLLLRAVRTAPFRRTPELRPRHPYPVLLAVRYVLPCPVNLVHQSPLRVMPCPRFVAFNRILQDRALIVGIEGDFLKPRMPVLVYAHVVLRPELHRRFRLPADNRPQVRLVEAHDPVVHPVHLVLVHVSLLPVKLQDGQVEIDEPMREGVPFPHVLRQVPEIPPDVPELLADSGTDFVGRTLLRLRQR